MPAIITTKTRIFLAKQFLASFTSITDPRSLYLFVGKVTPWPVDGEAPLPQNTEVMVKDAWQNMIGGKRVSPADYSHVIRRVDWAVNKVFAQYSDNNPNLFYSDFYCVTDDFNVYKCLDNNNNGPSSVKPTGTGTSVITLGDGYKWKFMYTINTAQAIKFMTNRWIPVQTLTADDGSTQWTVQENTIPGAIQSIEITEAGAGYSSAPSVVIQGDGTGATATATIAGGVVTKINVTNVGSGYTTAEVVITGAAATPATGRAVMSPIPNGHGKSAVDELGGYYVMCNTELQQDENGNLPTVNDFRHIGLIADPEDTSDPGVPSTLTAFNQTNVLTLTGVTGDFIVDEVVEGALSGATGVVVQWNEDDGELSVNNVTGTFGISEGVTGPSGSGAVAGMVDPEMIKYTGDILFIEYRSPISRADDQTEQVRVIFEF